MIRPLISLTLGIAILLPSVLRAEQDDTAKRLVQIHVTKQSTSPFLPWQQRRPSRAMGYGVVVRDKIILTTETLVRNNKLIEITLPGSGKKMRARKMLADMKVNLALLELLDEAPALPATELAIADALPIDAETVIHQTDDTSAIQDCSGTVLQISVASVSSASYRSLTYTLLTKPDVNNQGAPVFYEGKLAGLTVSAGQSAQQSMMIPFPVIARFLADAKEPPYSGFPSAGLMWAELVDPAKRKYFGLPENEERGIQVLSTIPGTGAAEQLKPNDVILTIDGAEIDSLGFYTDKDFGRLLFPYLINGRHTAGETLAVSVIRDKKKLDLKINLTPWDDSKSLIPEDHEGQMNDYIVSGGLVLRELSGRYLRSHGGDWQRRVGPRLAYYYQTLRSTPEQEGDRIIILSGILPDTINMGYQHIQNEIVTQINGVKVRNMKDLFKAVDEEKGLFSIGLQSLDIDLQLDPDELKDANIRLLDSYRIPAIDSRDLKTMQNGTRR